MHVSGTLALLPLLASMVIVEASPRHRPRPITTSTTTTTTSTTLKTTAKISTTTSSTTAAVTVTSSLVSKSTTASTLTSGLTSKPASSSTSILTSSSTSATPSLTSTSSSSLASSFSTAQSSATTTFTTSSTSSSMLAPISTTTSTSSTRSSTTVKPTTTATTMSSASATATGCIHAGKRGLGFNDATLTGPYAMCSNANSKVSWAYNWGSDPYYPNSPSLGTAYNTNLRFIPMLWSAAPELTSIWSDNVARARARYGADAVLAFNEPDNCDGQACMSVADAVTAWKKYVQPLAGTGLALGAPAVTNAQNQRNVGIDWLQQFLAACTGCTIDFVPLHFYGDVNKPDTLGQYVASVYNTINKPIWLTEFGAQGGDKDSVRTWLARVLTWLDSASASYVQRYAYLMDAPNSDDTWLMGANRSMNAIGQLYNS